KDLDNSHGKSADGKVIADSVGNNYLNECHATVNVTEKDSKVHIHEIQDIAISRTSLDQPVAAKRNMVPNHDNTQTLNDGDYACQSNNVEFCPDESYGTFIVTAEINCENFGNVSKELAPHSKPVLNDTSKNASLTEFPTANAVHIRTSSPTQSFVKDNAPVVTNEDSTKEMMKLNTVTNSVSNDSRVNCNSISSVNVVTNPDDLCRNNEYTNMSDNSTKGPSDASKKELYEIITKSDVGNKDHVVSNTRPNASVNVSNKISNIVSDVTNDTAFQTFVINESLDKSSPLQGFSTKTYLDHQKVEPTTFIIDSTNRNNTTFDLVSEICKSETDLRETGDSMNESYKRHEISKEKTGPRETLDIINDEMTHTAKAASRETLDLISETDDPFETRHIETSYEKRGLTSNLSFDLIQSSQPSRGHVNSGKIDSSEGTQSPGDLDMRNSEYEIQRQRNTNGLNEENSGIETWNYRNERAQGQQNNVDEENRRNYYQSDLDKNSYGNETSRTSAEQAQCVTASPYHETNQLLTELNPSLSTSSDLKLVKETFNEQLHHSMTTSTHQTPMTSSTNSNSMTISSTNHNPASETRPKPGTSPRTILTNENRPVPETRVRTNHNREYDINQVPVAAMRTSMTNSGVFESTNLVTTRVIGMNPSVTTSGSNIVPNYTDTGVPLNYTNSGVITSNTTIPNYTNPSVPIGNPIPDPVASTNPFLNPFIDYSEQNSMISADSIEVQRGMLGQQPFYSQPTPLTGPHGGLAGSHQIQGNATQNTSTYQYIQSNGQSNITSSHLIQGNGIQNMSTNYHNMQGNGIYSNGSTPLSDHMTQGNTNSNMSSSHQAHSTQPMNDITYSTLAMGAMSSTPPSQYTQNVQVINHMSPNLANHYTQPHVMSSSHTIHGTEGASATKISRSFSAIPSVNQINTSFSSTNPFLNDIQNATMVLSNASDIQNATMVLSNSNDIQNTTMVLNSNRADNPIECTFVISDSNRINDLGTTTHVSIINPQYGQQTVTAIHGSSINDPYGTHAQVGSTITEQKGQYSPSHNQVPDQYGQMETNHQPHDVMNQTRVIDNRPERLSDLEVQPNGLTDHQSVDSQVVYRREVKESSNTAELYIQHSTPLSASVDNLLEVNYTPIKPDDSPGGTKFDLNATQIKRLSCKLNDENLSKANEQLNALLAGDTSSPPENYSDLLVDETNSKTLLSKPQVPLESARPVDLNLSHQRACEDFHSPDSLNADDEIHIKHAHAHIDEDNRSKTSSDIDCIPIVSGGVASVPRQPSTSWTVEFPISRSSNQSGDTSRHSPRSGDHFADGTLSKSSTSLVKHGDSFSHNSKSCGFYIDLNEPCGVEEEDKGRNKPEKKMFNMFIDISNSDSSDKERSTKSPRPLLRKKLKPLSVTDRFLQRQCSSEDKTGSIGSGGEDSDGGGEHPEVTRGRTLFRNTNTPPPSTQASTTDQSMSDLTESGLRKHNSIGGNSSTSNSGSGFFMFIGTGDSNPSVVKRRLSSGNHGNQGPPARTHPNRHSWNSDSSGGGGGASGSANATGGGMKKHRRASSISCRLSDLDTSPSAPTDPSAKLTSSWHASSKKLTDSSDSSVLADTKSDQTSSSLKSDATYNIETAAAGGNEKSPGTEGVKCGLLETKEGREVVGTVVFKSIPEDSALDSSEPNETYVIERESTSKKGAEQLVLDTPTMIEEDGDKYADLDAIPTDGRTAPSTGGPESFVKLSDMDCPSSTGHRVLPPPTRLSRSTQDSRLGQGSLNLVQGSRSLTRLFPHLVAPSGGQQASLSSSQEDGHTTISTVSSLQSSNNRSTLDVSTDEADPSSAAPHISSLGADLLRMFLDEISADVTVEVAGRRIRAHKCVLSSRCQYFAAVLSGGWVESAGNVISLQGYSYSSVHFALSHIYSGAGEIPDNINIVELATLADMLCLEGLKEVISGVLKHKYCHYFHKPCNTCILGVIEVLPLAAAYGLDDIYRKSLRWIAKHFTRMWPTKPFAAMPKELIDKCLKQILVHMTSDNVLDTLQSVSKVYALLPSDAKWTEPVHSALKKLSESCAKYIAQHLSSVLTSTTLLALSRDQMWDIGDVEQVLMGAGSSLSPDEACRAYVQLDVMNNQTPHPTWHESFGHLLIQLQSTVKTCLVRQASKCCRSPAWSLMPPSLRLDIQETAGLIRVPGDEKRRARMMRKSESTSACAGGKLRGVDLAQVRQSIAQSQQPRKPPVPDLIPKAKPKFSEVKSRYLDSRPSRFSDPPPERKSASTSSSSSVTHTRPSGVSSNYNRASATGILSSSESSRQSSPAMAKRNIVPQPKDKTTSRLSLDSKLDANPAAQKKEDMRLIRDKLTLNIRKSHETDEDTKTMGVVKKPGIAMATRLPLRSNENRSSLTKSQSTTEKKTPDTKLTRTSRLSLDSGRSPFSESSRSSPKPTSACSVGGGRSRLSLESKSLRSSPLDNRTRESLRASTDRLSLDTLSSRNKRRTGSSSSTTSCSSTKGASLSTVTTPNLNKKPVNININRSPIKMNKTALLRSSAGQQRNTPNTPPPVTRSKMTRENSVPSNAKSLHSNENGVLSNGKNLHGNVEPAHLRNYSNQENRVLSNQEGFHSNGHLEEEGKKLGTRSGTFCLDESASILKNIGTPVS
ncbi:hypothetical protein WDU94_001589, partial [Cyamophila willieti]